MRHNFSTAQFIVMLMCASIAAQCATEGVILDQRARIKVEESIEDTQRQRLFGPSAYCLPVDSLKHCPGLSTTKIKSSTRDFGTDLSAEVFEPLERVLGMHGSAGIPCSLSTTNNILEGLNMTMGWEESRWSLKDMPYIPSNITNVGRVIAVGGFSKSPMVHTSRSLFLDGC